MTDWVVRRWARYGQERLYAETPGGASLGHLDVTTGRYHSDDITNLPLLKAAIDDHLAVQRSRASADAGGVVMAGTHPASSVHSAGGVPAQTATPEPTHGCVPGIDISGTTPGAAAWERALAERRAQGRVRHFLARLVDAKTQERSWRVGAQGEMAVAAQLARLDPSWRVLHAVRVGVKGSDIDHVVIGPGGVFTVNAKHHPRTSVWVAGETFMVNGRRVPYVRNSRHEAQRAARLLAERAGFPVRVTGIIAVMGAHNGFKVKKQPEDGAVIVVARKRISRLLAAQPVRLSPWEVAAIFDVARVSTTWR